MVPFKHFDVHSRTTFAVASILLQFQSGSPLSVTAGHFTSGGSPVTRTSESPCLAGTFCSGGVQQQCPAGSYGSSDLETDSACDGTCDGGYFCPAGSTSAQQFACGVGNYWCDVFAALTVLPWC